MLRATRSTFHDLIFRSLPFILFLHVGAATAQETADPSPLLKPTIALGTGMLGFYGDIGESHQGYSPLIGRPGFDLRASTPILPGLEGGLYFLYGQLGVNERSLERNLNFESRISSGGLRFTYDFGPLLKPGRSVSPFISLGFGSLEFLSKTDLYDAQGRAYHYWSDGTIRDQDESGPLASQAEVIERDYDYESDIRELDLDGFGKYPERSWVVPVGIGAKMVLGGGFDARIGATMHYTLTDLIDGVTDESIESRKGDPNNDMFLYSSFSLGYGINLERKEKVREGDVELSPELLAQLALTEDEDGDGITDLIDECPHTPLGVAVDARGCPLDGDGDGVPDHLDDELNTVAGAPVDERGVTLSDEALLLAYQIFMDSTGAFAAQARSMAQSTGKAPIRPKPARTYVVQVGSEVEDISKEMINMILSIPDVRTLDHNDTTFFVVGDYEKLPEALRRQIMLDQLGIDGEVKATEDGSLIDVSKEIAELGSYEGIEAHPDPGPSALVRVQLGAFSKPLSKNIFADVKDLVVVKGRDGLTRYFSGSFTDINAAARYKVDKLLEGFEGAFLVAFKNGERVSLKEAGATLTGPENLSPSLDPSTVNKELVRFVIQVGAFAGNVPADIMGLYIEVGNVVPIPGKDAVRYTHGNYGTKTEAEAELTRIKAAGLVDAFVAGIFNGVVIPIEDAMRLVGE